MRVAPSWYTDPEDETQERYWNGSQWSDRRRQRSIVAVKRSVPHVPTVGTPTRPQQGSSGLATIGGICYFLAALIAIGALVGGIALLVHTRCGVNPDDLSVYACGDAFSSYPFRAAGAAVFVGGLVQALVVAFVGYLAKVREVVS